VANVTTTSSSTAVPGTADGAMDGAGGQGDEDDDDEGGSNDVAMTVVLVLLAACCCCLCSFLVVRKWQSLPMAGESGSKRTSSGQTRDGRGSRRSTSRSRAGTGSLHGHAARRSRADSRLAAPGTSVHNYSSRPDASAPPRQGMYVNTSDIDRPSAPSPAPSGRYINAAGVREGAAGSEWSTAAYQPVDRQAGSAATVSTTASSTSGYGGRPAYASQPATRVEDSMYGNLRLKDAQSPDNPIAR